MKYPGQSGRAAIILLVLGLIGGCIVIRGGRTPLHERAKHTNVEHVADRSIRAETENGSIRVRRIEQADVSVEARIRTVTRERLESTRLVAERDTDGALVVRVNWPGGQRRNREGADLEIDVPDARGVRLTSSNGRLRTEGLEGEAVLRTSNGKLIAHRHAGPVRGETSNGAIEIRKSAGPLDVETSNGSIEIDLPTEAAGPVRAETSNGSIDLTVGEAFAGTLEMETSNGSLETEQLGEIRYISSGEDRLVLRFGERSKGSHRSRLETSNGNIEVRGRESP